MVQQNIILDSFWPSFYCQNHILLANVPQSITPDWCPQPKNYNSYDGGRGGRGHGRSAAEAMVALMVAVEAVEAMMVAMDVVAAMIWVVGVVVEVVVEAEVGVALGLMQPWQKRSHMSL